MELADVLDSKSSGSDTVPVRPRSPAPTVGAKTSTVLDSRNINKINIFRGVAQLGTFPSAAGGGFSEEKGVAQQGVSRSEQRARRLCCNRKRAGPLSKNLINAISGCSAVGSAPALGAGCREFEPLHSDQNTRFSF